MRLTLLLSIVALGCAPDAFSQTSEDVRSLRLDLDEIRDSQKMIKGQLDAIQKLLLQGHPAAAQPEAFKGANLNLGGSYSLGDRNAKIALIEFTDYQCPYCGRHFRQTLPQIIDDYVKPGRVRYIQRDFPPDHTAVFIMWDDSDGWYDHAMGLIVSQSATPKDALTNGGCGVAAKALGGIEGRCGYGPRLPFLLISPLAKVNFVDHLITDQSSAIRLIEDNWLHGQRLGGGSFDSLAGSPMNLFDFDDSHPHARKLFLDPSTGEISYTEN